MTRRPSPAVAARRRRALLWFPLLVLGSFVYLAAYEAMGLNSLTMLGAAALIAGAAGLAAEAGK